MESHIVPVATGPAWVGYGVRAFDSVIRELIGEARDELVLTVYLLTSREIVAALERALSRGVAVEVFLDGDTRSKSDIKLIDQLYALRTEYPYLQISEVNSGILHAKIIIADGRRVLVGSANLSPSALLNNYELGILLEDNAVAGKIRDLIEKLRPQ